MPEGGFLQQRSKSPGSFTIVIALHATAITALMLAKTTYERKKYDPIVVNTIESEKDPPPIPEPQRDEAKPSSKSEIVYVAPKVDTRPQDPVVLGQPTDWPALPDSGPVGTSDDKGEEPVPLPPPPMPDPVRVEARIDPRSELQPPYPASEERAQREGSVTVQLLVGSDGRVKEVDKVRATSDAFYRATEQQALRRWRFKPATVDGRPVESRTSLTVHFRLSE